jgi:hypothetical protein
MSFMGKVQARCPGGCEPRDVEIWSFVNGGKDPELRDSLMAGDLNLISCEQCGNVYFPDAAVVYYDAPAELLAFVFPESYRTEEARWRKKMEEDYAQMQSALPERPVTLEPKIYFGMEALSNELHLDDAMADEVEIVQVLAQELKMAVYHVDRSFARSRNLPWLLPFPGQASPTSLKEGLGMLLGKNDRLESYRRWQPVLGANSSLPPGTF